MRTTLFYALFVVSLLSLIACSSAEKYDINTPEGAFQSAEELEKDERYEEAIQRYSDVKNKHPYSRFAVLSELKIADVHFAREAYIEAQNAYQIFKEFHPKHPRSDYVTFRLALSYFKQLPATIDRDLSVAEKAILYFDEVANSYSTSEFAKEAKERRQESLRMLAEKEVYIAGFYSKREKYDSALKRYEFLLKTYPGQGFDSQALYNAARCAFELGDREKATAHLKNLNSQYPESDEAQRAKTEFSKYGTN